MGVSEGSCRISLGVRLEMVGETLLFILTEISRELQVGLVGWDSLLNILQEIRVGWTKQVT